MTTKCPIIKKKDFIMVDNKLQELKPRLYHDGIIRDTKQKRGGGTPLIMYLFSVVLMFHQMYESHAYTVSGAIACLDNAMNKLKSGEDKLASLKVLYLLFKNPLYIILFMRYVLMNDINEQDIVIVSSLANLITNLDEDGLESFDENNRDLELEHLPLPATQNHEERNHLGIKLFQIPKARNKSFVPRKQKIDEIPSYNSDDIPVNKKGLRLRKNTYKIKESFQIPTARSKSYVFRNQNNKVSRKALSNSYDISLKKGLQARKNTYKIDESFQLPNARNKNYVFRNKNNIIDEIPPYNSDEIPMVGKKGLQLRKNTYKIKEPFKMPDSRPEAGHQYQYDNTKRSRFYSESYGIWKKRNEGGRRKTRRYGRK